MAVGPVAAAFLEGDPEADDHDVLPLLGVPHRFDGELPLEAQPPLGPVYDEQPSGAGDVAAVGDLAVGVGQGHLLGDDYRNALDRAQLAGKQGRLGTELVEGSEVADAQRADEGVDVGDVDCLRRPDAVLAQPCPDLIEHIVGNSGPVVDGLLGVVYQREVQQAVEPHQPVTLAGIVGGNRGAVGVDVVDR